jgi:hypothetical protein
LAISNELSSDIAAAILAAKDKHTGELNDLKEMILKVHSTLQQLGVKPRSDRAFAQAAEQGKRSSPRDA